MSDGTNDEPSRPEDVLWDVIIVGGGPAGLSAAIYSARGGAKTLIVDKDKGSGAMGGSHLIANYPGFPEAIRAEDLLERFYEQAVNLGAFMVQDNVVYSDFRKDEKLVATPNRTFRGRTVILATGSMGREPSIEGEKPFVGRGVHYCAICDGPNMNGKKVAVVGQVNRLHDELELLSKFASEILVLSPTSKFDDESMALLRSFEKVVPIPDRSIVRIPPGPTFNGLIVRSPSGEEGTIVCDAVFIHLLGNRPVTDYLADPLEKSENGCILTGQGGSTSIDGVFAVGDISCRDVRQISLAVSEGMRAALSAQAKLSGRSAPSSQWGIRS